MRYFVDVYIFFEICDKSNNRNVHVWCAFQTNKPDMDILDYLDHDPDTAEGARNASSSPEEHLRHRSDFLTNQRLSLDWMPIKPRRDDGPELRPLRMFKK